MAKGRACFPNGWRRVDLCGRQHTYLRLSLTEKCNLRCRYCMPEAGVPLQPTEHMLTTDEIVEIGTRFNKWGVDKIRLTGGEPLVNKDIGLICREFGQLPNMDTLAITTNGLVLPRKLPIGKTGMDASFRSWNAYSCRKGVQNKTQQSLCLSRNAMGL